MTLRAGVLAYWSYAFASSDLELGLHINQLKRATAASAAAAAQAASAAASRSSSASSTESR
jgi:hypothetical protein